MHFPDLTQMGASYANEEGTGGVRQSFLDGVATNLRKLRMDLNAAKAKTQQQIGTGSVKTRAAFFQSGAGGKQREDAEKEERELERKITAAEAKLVRQGAVLKPDGTIDWVLTSRQVIYDHTAAAQGLTRLHPHNDGLLYTAANHLTKFDTSGMVTAFGGKGWAIYVMSDTGNIHVSSHSVGHRHHSSLLAGANVAGAGEMRVLQGKLVHISNKSGHYAPAAAHFLQVFHVLRKRRVSLFNTKLSFKTATGQTDYTSVDAFMTALRANGIDTDYEFTKMMAYLNPAILPYHQFVPLAAAQGWRWGTAADFALGAPAAGGRGVVRISDGTQVSHSDVRKWLKSLGRTFNTTVQSGAGR
jgi:hypothetical protein